jgi:hypothetical protein
MSSFEKNLNEHNSKKKLFGGLSKIEIEVNEFELGDGIKLRKTFAHLMAPFVMAFNPPSGEGVFKHLHRGPYKPAKGGIDIDVFVEIEVQTVKEFSNSIDNEGLIWLIACLIRLGKPFVTVSTLSDLSFREIDDKVQPTIHLVEIKNRIFLSKEERPFLEISHLEWIKQYWKSAARLINTNRSFYLALKAFDDSTLESKKSSALLTVWGVIEHLFSPPTGELKYRVSSNLAAFLEAYGSRRLELFKELTKLYNERSKAAHTSKEIDVKAFIDSYYYLRDAIIKIIERGSIPTQEELENLIFKADS